MKSIIIAFILIPFFSFSQDICDEFSEIPFYSSSQDSTIQSGDYVNLSNSIFQLKILTAENISNPPGTNNSLQYFFDADSTTGIFADCLFNIERPSATSSFYVEAYPSIPNFFHGFTINGEFFSNGPHHYFIYDYDMFPITLGNITVAVDTSTTLPNIGYLDHPYRMTFSGLTDNDTILLHSSWDIVITKMCKAGNGPLSIKELDINPVKIIREEGNKFSFDTQDNQGLLFIFNTSGQFIGKYEINNQLTINLNHLSSGVYFTKVEIDKNVYIDKILIE